MSKEPFLTIIDEVRLVAERKLKNPQVCGNWTTRVIPTTNGLKDKSQRKLENILTWMKFNSVIYHNAVNVAKAVLKGK